MATEPERLVRAFLTAMGPAPADIRAAVDDFLTGDCVWENPGSPVCRGREQILALMPPDFARLDVRFRAVATAGDTVLMERVEDMIRVDGTFLARNLKVMAAFEVRGDRISAWRDYFDITTLISEPDPSLATDPALEPAPGTALDPALESARRTSA